MKTVRFVELAFLALAVALSAAARAAGIDQLRVFIENTRGAKAEFTQTVSAKSGRKPQTSSGTFVFSRPGKFRWIYDKPYYQLLVSDGEKLWIHDRDLNQVTVKRIGKALGSSPAALLAGDNAFENNFTVKNAESAEQLEWIEATPNQPDGSFEWVRIGFRDNLPRAMELRDSFGQTTRLAFGALQANPALDAGLFRYTPPPGADVVSE
jgi:outer membrane lipoprotein carrier protein